MLVKIEKDIPLPEPKRRKYPWHEMEVGDSFIFPHKHGQQYASVMSRRHSPKKYAARMVGGKYRIWRVE